MKTIEATLLTHLGEPVTTTCALVKIECVGTYDGTVLTYTSLDIDVEYDDLTSSYPLTYESDNGFSLRRLAQTLGLSVDSSEIDGIVAVTGVTKQMIFAGVFNSAKVTIYRVNYNLLTPGSHEVIAYGRLGETKFEELAFNAEYRSLSQLLKQIISQPYSRTCIAQFGSTGVRWACNKAFTWANGAVTSLGAETDRIFNDTSIVAANGYYSDHSGVIEWLTGDNAGAQMEIDLYTVGHFELSLPMPFAIQSGDTFRVRRDCDKLFETCRDVHANNEWFRGQNKIPVDGKAMIPGAEIIRA